MLSEAIGSLARAERLRQQFFVLQSGPREACWEPPIDVLETDDEVLILVALPGVDPEKVEAVIDGDGVLTISEQRAHPSARAAAGPLRAADRTACRALCGEPFRCQRLHRLPPRQILKTEIANAA
jgi:hypothetical protein